MKLFSHQFSRLGLVLCMGLALGCHSIAEEPAGKMKPYAEKLPNSKQAIDMVPIPGGTFMMGSPESEEDRGDGEGPQIKVKVDPFYMGKYEITWDQMDVYLELYSKMKNDKTLKKLEEDQIKDAVSFPTPLYAEEAVPIISRMGRKDGFPAASMSQFNARQFTKWLSKVSGKFYRLPTEAEWEYAARAGTTTAFSWGDDPDKAGDYAWYFDNSELDDGFGAYRKVGQKKPNPYGLYDMHGNVAEWVIDQYDEKHYKKFAGKTVNALDIINWPKELYPRIVRGGGWDHDPVDLRSAARIWSDKEWIVRDPQKPTSVWWNTETFWVGFRVVRPLKEPTEEEKRKYWEIDDEYTKFKYESKSARQIRVIIEKAK